MRFAGRLGADAVNQGMRVKELMLTYANEKLNVAANWEALIKAEYNANRLLLFQSIRLLLTS